MKPLNFFVRKKKMFVLFLFALFFLSPLYADQGYAVFDESSGTLTFKYGTPEGTLNVDYYNTDNTGTSDPGWLSKNTLIKRVVFERTFGSARPTSFYKWFCGCTNLNYVAGILYNPSGYRRSTNLNGSSVTNMSYMFYDCINLETLNLVGLSTISATNMSNMFANCRSLRTLNLRGFSFSSLTNANRMFYNCSSLTTLFCERDWNVSTLTSSSEMFTGCTSLKSISSDVSYSGSYSNNKVFANPTTGYFSSGYGFAAFDAETGVLTFKYGNPYDGTYSAIRIMDDYDLNIGADSDWPWYEVRDQIKRVVFEPSFAYARPISCYYWFKSFPISSIDGLEYLNTENVTNMGWMFAYTGSGKITSLDLSHFNTSNVANMSYMFYGFAGSEINMNNFNTENVTGMGWMFADTRRVERLDLSSFNTARVTGMDVMFQNNDHLISVVFGREFSTESLTELFWIGSPSLRYVDFFACDDTDAINSENKLAQRIASYAVVYLPHGSQEIIDRPNVVYSYNGNENDLRCPNYISTVYRDCDWYINRYGPEYYRFGIEFPRSFKTNKAEYHRTMSNTYGSVILPYEFKSNEDIQAYTLDEEHTETMYFVDAETVPAHTPFAFKKLGNADFVVEDETGNFGITVNATHTTTAKEGGTPYTHSENLGGWTTKGYYVSELVNDYENTFYIAGDRFYRADGPLTMYPHRVTFHGTWQTEPSVGEGSKFYEIATLTAPEKTEEVLDTDEELPSEVITAIEAADLRREVREAQAIYDAQGHRLSEIQKGLNIIRQTDGSVKKVIIR